MCECAVLHLYSWHHLYSCICTCNYLVPFADIHRLKQQVLVWLANNMSQYEDQSLNMWNIAVKVWSRTGPHALPLPFGS